METIEFLRNALKEANEIIDNYKQTIDELSDENSFLTDTITINKLGKITTERRDMQMNMFRMQAESEKAVSDAKKTVKEYNSKLDEINRTAADVKDKQKKINTYIDEEAKKKVKKARLECKSRLDQQIKENDIILQDQINKYQYRSRIMLYVTIGSIIFGIICLFINFA